MSSQSIPDTNNNRKNRKNGHINEQAAEKPNTGRREEAYSIKAKEDIRWGLTPRIGGGGKRTRQKGLTVSLEEAPTHGLIKEELTNGYARERG